MDILKLKHVPVPKAGMLIRKSVADVFEAIVNKDIPTTPLLALVVLYARSLHDNNRRLKLDVQTNHAVSWNENHRHDRTRTASASVN